MTSDRPRTTKRYRLLALGVAAATVTLGLVAPLTSPAQASESCSERNNNSAAKLIPCIRTADLMKHMVNFQKIADANPGPDGHPSRNSGEPGYKASADYVAKAMKAAGYSVKLQTYTFNYFSFVGTPTFSQVSPTPQSFTVGTDFNPGQASGPAASAQAQAAAGNIIPPTPTPSSAAGCDPADFANFVRGRIALVQRGTCTFGTKATNAEAAGASGVVIFNEGQPGRDGLFSGSLVLADNSPAVLHIPVVFTSFALGSSLVAQAATSTPPVLSISVQAIQDPNRADYNVIAESKGGDPNHVVVVDAHLDAIFGSGMLDNASGSAAILDIAQMMRKVHPKNKLRFIWFGGEELGLLGSNFYVDNLTPTELGKIGFDLDADVLATPNYDVGVLDPEGVQLFSRGPGTAMPPAINAPSRVARDFGIQYLDSIGKNHILFSADGTDAFVFEQAGIPASGVLTGQDCCKTADDVALFGGFEGNFEGTVPGTDGGCVDNPFRWCDNLSNNDPKVLTFMSRAFATMVVKMAFDTTVLTRPHGPKSGRHTHQESRNHPDN
jgi:hypothetical protein